MIEMIYHEEENPTEEGTVQEPKNVRQMGEPKEYKRIYIEDYVHTFLLQYSTQTDEKAKVAILLGETKKSGGRKQTYIRSALPVEKIEEKQGKYQFTETIWGTIYQECGQHFMGQEILGWFVSRMGISTEKTEVLEETHRTYFSGADKLLFSVEPVEQEATFWGFDGNRFAKQPGYYIYYEKNEPMHQFLTEKNGGEEMSKKNEKPDVAMANFRKILQEKKQDHDQRKKKAVSYGALACAVLLLFAGAVMMKNQMDRIKVMEQQLLGMSDNQTVQETFEDAVIVEELPGEVDEKTAQEELLEEIPVTEEAEPEDTEEVQNDQMPEERAEPEPVVEEKTAEETAAPAYQEYLVQQGDTLAKISRDRYGNEDMIGEICALNGISDGDYIQVGEIILLP